MTAVKLSYRQLEDYLRQYINIYCALGVREEFWLTPREKEFFIACVIIYNKGINLSSKKATLLLESQTNFKKETKGVYIYRNKLKAKGWLANTKDGLTIPKAFIFKDGVPDLKLNISLKYEHPKEDRSSGVRTSRDESVAS